MNVEYLEFTDQIRSKVLSSISLILVFIISLLALFNVTYHSYYLYALIQLFFSFFSLYIFIKSKKGACSPKIVFLYLFYIALLMLLGFSLLPLSDVVFLWAFFFPTISYLLLGQHLGLRLSLIVFLSLSAVLVYRLLSSNIFTVPPVMINFVGCYLTIWCISHFVELNRSKTQQSLIKLALTDVLTDTNNRLAFTKSFDHHLASYLLMIDLDNFKAINDKFGHDTGDNVLILVSDCLKKIIKSNLIFRIGGEEFCVWFPIKDMNQAVISANEIREKVANIEFYYGTERIWITLSGGLVKNEANLAKSELLKRADKLLYQGKKQGKNKIICE